MRGEDETYPLSCLLLSRSLLGRAVLNMSTYPSKSLAGHHGQRLALSANSRGTMSFSTCGE